MDAEETALIVLAAQKESIQQTPTGFLAETGLDEDAFREVAKIFAGRRKTSPHSPETPVQTDIQVGYNLAKILEKRRG